MNKRTNNITIHLTDTELVIIETLASSEDRKISEFVRLELMKTIYKLYALYETKNGLEKSTDFQKLTF